MVKKLICGIRTNTIKRRGEGMQKVAKEMINGQEMLFYECDGCEHVKLVCDQCGRESTMFREKGFPKLPRHNCRPLLKFWKPQGMYHVVKVII